MRLSELQPDRCAKIFDTMILLRLPNGEFDCALPGSPLKSGSFDENVLIMDIAQSATIEEFIEAVKKADHQGDWYSMLLSKLMLERANTILFNLRARVESMTEGIAKIF